MKPIRIPWGDIAVVPLNSVDSGFTAGGIMIQLYFCFVLLVHDSYLLLLFIILFCVECQSLDIY